MFQTISHFYPCWYKLQWFTKPNRSIDGGFRDFWNWRPWKLEEIIQFDLCICSTNWVVELNPTHFKTASKRHTLRFRGSLLDPETKHRSSVAPIFFSRPLRWSWWVVNDFEGQREWGFLGCENTTPCFFEKIEVEMSCCGRDDKLKTCRWLCMKVQVLFLSICSYVFCVFRLDFFGVSMRGVVTSPVESSDSERVWKPEIPWSQKLTPIQDEEANRKCPTWRSSWIHVLNIKIGSKLGPLNFFMLYEHYANNTLEFWFKNHWWSSHVCLMQLSVDGMPS